MRAKRALGMRKESKDQARAGPLVREREEMANRSVSTIPMTDINEKASRPATPMPTSLTGVMRPPLLLPPVGL